MKRTLVIAILIMLLVSSAGAMIVGAVKPPVTPPVKSGIYQFTVAGIDGSAKGIASGKLTLNTKANTFAFSGRNAGEDGTSYDLYYVIGAVEMKLATAPAALGTVTMTGTLPPDVNWADVTGAVVKLAPTLRGISGVQITNFDTANPNYDKYWLMQAGPKWSGQTGTVTQIQLAIYDARNTQIFLDTISSAGGVTFDQISAFNLKQINSPSCDKSPYIPFTVIMTIRDDLGDHVLPAETVRPFES
ncbi:MAG: hypothetical protein ACXVI0_10020 [Halobacteriota archaeon]